MSDVPIGALLSGGIDSGAVVGIMSRMATHPVRTFTVGFAGQTDVDEIEEARRTAALFGTAHTDIVLSTLDYQSLLPKAIWHLDEPIATTSALAMYSVCTLARKHVTVVLTGQGADEPLAGYPRHLGERYGAWYRRLAGPVTAPVISRLAESVPRCERLKRAVRSLTTQDVTERFAQVYAVFTPQMKHALWQPYFRHDCGNARAHAVIDYWRRSVTDLDPLLQMAFIDARLSLSDDLLTYGDKMSMAASIEARVPFLDLDYMQVVESLPASLRIRGLTQKYIHKRALAKWLPPEVIHRRKRGFETPVDRWFRTELSGYVRTVLLAPDSACRSFFRSATIEELLDAHITGRGDCRRQLFSLLVFELWHRLFISHPSLRPVHFQQPQGALHHVVSTAES
jgi:asparagine synthase (glutamine-hydrolysing)